MLEHDLFFSYGPDLDPEFLKTRGGRDLKLATAKLRGFRLAFYGYSELNQSAYETLVPDPEGEVWGVLYRFARFDWERMDSVMGARLDGGGMYFHYPVEVETAEGQTYGARIYLKDILGKPSLPNRDYFELILKGARHHELPASYLERLQAYETQAPVVQKPRRQLKVISGESDCRSCGHGASEVQEAV